MSDPESNIRNEHFPSTLYLRITILLSIYILCLQNRYSNTVNGHPVNVQYYFKVRFCLIRFSQGISNHIRDYVMPALSTKKNKGEYNIIILSSLFYFCRCTGINLSDNRTVLENVMGLCS